jgi:molybdopterin-binding protein
MRTVLRSIATGVVTATALVCGAAAAEGTTAVTTHSALRLQLRQGTSVHGPVLAAVILTCDPDGGTHPRPDLACTALRDVDGRFEQLPSDGTLCPLNLDPVTASAYGKWRGRWIRFAQVYTNRCVAEQQTNGVFRF